MESADELDNYLPMGDRIRVSLREASQLVKASDASIHPGEGSDGLRRGCALDAGPEYFWDIKSSGLMHQQVRIARFSNHFTMQP